MGFCIGDRVALLDDVVKGVVERVDESFVFVKTDDGMLCQFDSSELVKLGVEQHELTKYSDINNRMLLQKTKVSGSKKSLFKKSKNEVVMEVDLHIEKILKSAKGLDNFDKLNIQLNTAKHKLEYCIKKKISKIIFIHGVGEGVLKAELHYMLNNYPVNYTDASYQKYGLGATEVYVYQNP